VTNDLEIDKGRCQKVNASELLSDENLHFQQFPPGKIDEKMKK
jgi:hypothetical protein